MKLESSMYSVMPKEGKERVKEIAFLFIRHCVEIVVAKEGKGGGINGIIRIWGK